MLFFLFAVFLLPPPSFLISSPGLQAASPETLPQPDLWQWVQVRPQWEATGGRGSGESQDREVDNLDSEGRGQGCMLDSRRSLPDLKL